MYQSYFKQSYTYEGGDYAPENYLLEKYEGNSKYSSKLTKKKAGDTVQGDAYTIEKPEDEEVVTKMIFDGTSEENGYVKSYWLASASMGLNYDGDAKFGIADVCGDSAASGYDEFSSNGWWIAYEFAVRPVITLKSGVTLEDIKTRVCQV